MPLSRRAFLQQALTLSTALPFCFPDRPVLLTGFEPFAGSAHNPTKDVVEAIAKEEAIDTMILPVAFRTAAEKVITYIEREHPAVVLSLGLKGDPYITIEERGQNIMNSFVPDNRGYRPQGERIAPAPEYLPCTSNTAVLEQLLQQAGFPVRTSQNAGTYVCNDFIYRVSYHLHSNELPTAFAFLHIPWTTNYETEQYAQEIPFLQYYQKLPLEEVVGAVWLVANALR